MKARKIMAKTTGATAVAEKPTDALWLAALPTPRITVAQDRLPAPVQAAVRPRAWCPGCPPR